MVNHLLETSHPFLRPLRDSVSLWLPRLPSSVHTSKFRIPQILCLPLLRKYPGVWGYSSHFGTDLQSVPHATPARIPRSNFAFSSGPEILPSEQLLPRFLFCPLPAKGHGQRATVLFTVARWLNPPWGQPSEGSIMKRLFVAAMLLGSVSVARAQTSAPTLQVDRGNAAQDFAATAAARAMPLSDLAAADTFSSPAAKPANSFAAPVVTTALAMPLENGEPASPPPQPKFLYGGRDDYRWELGLGATWLRFRSTVFNASAVGVNISVVYFTNEWFGIEGNITAAFAPTIFANEHVKIATYGAGPKVAWRQKQWEPWLHGI